MFYMILMFASAILALIFTFMKHPLASGLMLLLQTLLVCLITGLTTQNFWFSYILFLVFLGGLLVLFIYVTSLASNEMFSLSTLILIVAALPFTAIVCFTLMVDSLPGIYNLFTADMVSLNNMTSNNEESSLFLMKLYNNPTSLITLMLVLYLFLTLIAVVKITKIFHGPLRPKN
uniref:NADH-ubiquinone oxidoreductase chain 6 n=1 Tax=Calineuria stigmatica TaxID=1661801 RepID=A0A6B9PIM9_9NEOP|nr:NADH dehydrogenase subunit 6 [Calineuria stigmatica]